MKRLKRTNATGIIALALLTGAISLHAEESRKDSLWKNRTIDEVVVTGTRSEVSLRHLPMNVSVINRSQIEQRYEPSLLPLLTEQVPGLFVTSRGVLGYGVSGGAAGGMTLRGIGGGPTTGLLVLIDGHPQYMGLMGHPIADAYQSMLAEKVEVVSGPASILYGSNAMGGVINIVTRKQLEDGIRTNARLMYGSYNTMSVEAGNTLRKGRLSTLLSLNYDRTDGHREDMGFEQYGGYAKVGYDFTPQWKVFADVNLTHFNASNPGTVSNPLLDNDSRITRGMTSLSLENNYERTSGAFKLFYNWGRHKINDGYAPGANPRKERFNSTDQMLGITWYQTVSLFTGNQTTFGIDYQRFGGEAYQQFPDKRVDMADEALNEVAGYVNFRQQIGERLTLNAGVRADYHERTGMEWIPQLGASLATGRNGVLKAIVSRGFRNPTIKDLYMFGMKNPDLQPESLMNYELSFAQQLCDNRLSYTASVFYINGDNVIQQVAGKLINTGKIENYGLEVATRYRFSQSFALSANYSWLHMKNKVVAAPEHKLYAGADFTQGRWSASTGVQYIHRLYTAVNPMETTDSFVLWNVRGAYRLCRGAELFVNGENQLAQRYEINAGYPMPKATVMGGISLNF